MGLFIPTVASVAGCNVFTLSPSFDFDYPFLHNVLSVLSLLGSLLAPNLRLLSLDHFFCFSCPFARWLLDTHVLSRIFIFPSPILH